MRQGDKKKFLSKPKLYEMLNLRRNGFSYNILSYIFEVDRTSLAYQCDRYNIKPLEVYNFKGIVAHFLPRPEPPKWKIVNGERFHL